jgi:RHS repeat-associated protein
LGPAGATGRGCEIRRPIPVAIPPSGRAWHRLAAFGNITDIDDIGLGVRGRNFAYDALHRLTQGQELASGGSPVTLQTDYSYDAVGNRLTRDAGGSLETLAYDAFSNRPDTVPAGGIVRTLGYSASGNTDSDDDGLGTVLTKLYDSTDRLNEVKQGAAAVAAYLHNAQGQRVAKTVGVAVTHYVYDLGGNLIAEADGGTGAAQAEYVWLGGMPLAYIQGGTAYFVHADHLGTPQRVTDAAAAMVWDASYRPFGEATVTGALTFNLRFPGQYKDAETGLHYNYFRDYDASLGRYIQSDPIGLRGGWNTYAYVGGNPVMRTDSIGLFAICPPGKELDEFTPGCGPGMEMWGPSGRGYPGKGKRSRESKTRATPQAPGATNPEPPTEQCENNDPWCSRLWADIEVWLRPRFEKGPLDIVDVLTCDYFCDDGTFQVHEVVMRVPHAWFTWNLDDLCPPRVQKSFFW